MNKPYETYQLDWQGYRIEVRYCPSWSPSYEEIYGECMAHLELMSLEEPRLPLPVTETVRRQNIWRRSRRKIAEWGPRLGIDIRRRACGAASADVRWSVA